MTVTNVGVIVTGEKGIDYAYRKNINDVKALRAAGNTFVFRYLSGDKALTQPEVVDLHSVGFKIIVGWEMESTAPLQGYKRGVADGKAASAAADSLGYPDVAPVVATFDYDVTRYNLAVSVDYAHGFRSGLRAARYMGAYADTDLLNNIRQFSVCNWLPAAYAWSPNPPTVKMHFKQTTGMPGYDNNVSTEWSYSWKKLG